MPMLWEGPEILLNYEEIRPLGEVLPDMQALFQIERLLPWQSTQGHVGCELHLRVAAPQEVASLAHVERFTFGSANDPHAQNPLLVNETFGARLWKKVLDSMPQVPQDARMSVLAQILPGQTVGADVVVTVDPGTKDPQYKGQLRNRITWMRADRVTPVLRGYGPRDAAAAPAAVQPAMPTAPIGPSAAVARPGAAPFATSPMGVAAAPPVAAATVAPMAAAPVAAAPAPAAPVGQVYTPPDPTLGRLGVATGQPTAVAMPPVVAAATGAAAYPQPAARPVVPGPGGVATIPTAPLAAQPPAAAVPVAPVAPVAPSAGAQAAGNSGDLGPPVLCGMCQQMGEQNPYVYEKDLDRHVAQDHPLPV